MLRLRSGTLVIELMARCVWCQQDGLMSHVIGLAFDELGEQERGRLAALLAALHPAGAPAAGEPTSIAA